MESRVNKNTVLRILLLVLLLCTQTLVAQDFKEVIRTMRDDYSKWNALHIVMNILVYDSMQMEPFHQQQVEIKRQGDNYLYLMEENEMLMNEACLIAVDRSARQITYSLRSIAAEKEMYKEVQFSVDSILAQYDTPLYLGTDDGIQHYVVRDKKGEIQKVHFYVNSETKLLKQVEYEYRGGQKARIEFVLFQRDPKFKTDTFSTERFVVRSQKKLTPARLYYNYQVVDLTAKR